MEGSCNEEVQVWKTSTAALLSGEYRGYLFKGGVIAVGCATDFNVHMNLNMCLAR